jgi:hypothetical protein
MEQIDCLEVRVKLAEITGSKFLVIMRRRSDTGLPI